MASEHAGISFQPIQAIFKRITRKTRLKPLLFYIWKMRSYGAMNKLQFSKVEDTLITVLKYILAENMPYCKKCGNKTLADAAFCPSCGAPVAAKAPQKTRYVVGSPPRGERVVYQASSQMYCDYCGSRMLDIDKSGKCSYSGCNKIVCEKCMRIKDGKVFCPKHACFIAAACYGSPLEAPVSFLREFRDCEVMSTKVGKQFMRCFNKVYYSFSPALARFIEQHKHTRVLVRNLFVAPLIRLLKFSERVTRPISNKEVRVFATGVLTTLTIFLVFYLIIYLLRLAF